MIHVDEYPNWSRDLEIRRRLVGIPATTVSQYVGKTPSWWHISSLRVTPPSDWADCVERVEACIDGTKNTENGE